MLKSSVDITYHKLFQRSRIIETKAFKYIAYRYTRNLYSMLLRETSRNGF